jgi:hypothetical protein
MQVLHAACENPLWRSRGSHHKWFSLLVTCSLSHTTSQSNIANFLTDILTTPEELPAAVQWLVAAEMHAEKTLTRLLLACHLIGLRGCAGHTLALVEHMEVVAHRCQVAAREQAVDLEAWGIAQDGSHVPCQGQLMAAGLLVLFLQRSHHHGMAEEHVILA